MSCANARGSSYATNLGTTIPGQRHLDVYVWLPGQVVNASGYAADEPPGAVSLYPALSYNGSSVTFGSNNTFTAADTNRITDVYRARLRYEYR